MSFEGSPCEAVGVCLMLGNSLSDDLRSHVEHCTRCRSAGELSRGLHGALGAGAKWAKGDVVLEQYEVLEELGSGGQGTVYKARDLETALIVALKVVALQRHAVEEVRLAANITHPNVCRINHTKSADPFRVIVMEYVRGGTLRERLARGPIPTKQALLIFRGICDGVRAAHDRDVLHLDLKPGNVLLRDGVVPVVCDFGLATTSGAAARGGTDGYMAPEQATGDRLDQRTDIYALGVILRDLVPRPSRNLRRVIARASALSPDLRFATVAELIGSLDDSRRTVPAVLTAFVVLTVLAAAVAVASKGNRNPARSTPMSATKEVVPAAATEPPTASGIAAAGSSATMEHHAGPSGSDASAVAVAVPRPTTSGSGTPPHIPSVPTARADMTTCCGALEALSRRHRQPNVLNVASACAPLVTGGYGGTIKSMVDNNLSCRGIPPPCEPVPVPAECR